MCSRKQWLEAEEMQGPQLPDDIMYLIIVKLMVFPANLARFSAVCKRWHQLVCDAWPKLVHQDHSTPLVLVPTIVSPGPTVWEYKASCQIYNLMEECALTPLNSLPDPFNRIIGSSLGWLIVRNGHINDDNIVLVSLFNPLSKSHIRLPPMLPAPWEYPPNLEYPANLVKGVLSKPPLPEDQHFDIAITINSSSWNNIYKSATMLAFLHVEKIGELESLQWVYHPSTTGENVILDVNSIGGKICILYTSGFISCCKCSSTYRLSCYYGVRATGWHTSLFPSGFSDDKLYVDVHLLESSSSEPLVVFRYKVWNFGYYCTVGFKILTLTSSGNDEEINEYNKTWNWTEDKATTVEKMPQHQSLLNWTKIKTLGNDVIFLNDNDSFCIQVGSKMQQPAGSIYFYNRYLSKQETEFGVFNIDQECLTHFTHRLDDTKFYRRGPIWLMPSYSEILKFSSIS